MKKRDNVIRKKQISGPIIQSIWLLILAAVMYAASVGGVSAVYWRIYEKMMNIWAVTAENVMYAPRWTQFLYSWSGVFVRLIQNALLIGAGAWLAGLSGKESSSRKNSMKRWGGGALTGAICILLMWGILLAVGSVRLGWRLRNPSLSVSTVALAITVLANTAGESVFFYDGIWPGMKKRLPAWAACACMAFFSVLTAVLGGTRLPMLLVNQAFMALVCFAIAETAGLAGVMGFRFAWNFMDQAILGFAGTEAMYETYPVNLYWLNGGNGGILNGWMATIVLCVLLAVLLRGKIRINLRAWKANDKSPT